MTSPPADEPERRDAAEPDEPADLANPTAHAGGGEGEEAQPGPGQAEPSGSGERCAPDADAWVLDEGFVAGAHRVEPSADERARRRARSRRPPRRLEIDAATERRFAERLVRRERDARLGRALVIGAVVALVVLTAALGWWAGDGTGP